MLEKLFNIIPKIQPDKMGHFIAGLLIYATLHFVSPTVGLVAAVVLGALKEMYDYFHPKTHTADMWDFGATVFGGLVGFLCGL